MSANPDLQLSSEHPEVHARTADTGPLDALDITAGDGTDGTDGARWDGVEPSAQAWSAASYALFDGDQGGLELEQRRALVALVKNRFISSETHPREWRALLAHPDDIVARLNDLFLVLHLDREREVAWKQQVQPEGGGTFPTLLYDVAWKREATIALVFLRTRQRAEAMAGNAAAFVDREEIVDFIDSVRPVTATDRVADAKRAQRAVDDLCSANLLLGRKDDQRYQIARAIEALLPLDALKRLRDAVTATVNAQPDLDQPDLNQPHVDVPAGQDPARQLPREKQ